MFGARGALLRFKVKAISRRGRSGRTTSYPLRLLSSKLLLRSALYSLNAATNIKKAATPSPMVTTGSPARIDSTAKKIAPTRKKHSLNDTMNPAFIFYGLSRLVAPVRTDLCASSSEVCVLLDNVIYIAKCSDITSQISL